MSNSFKPQALLSAWAFIFVAPLVTVVATTGYAQRQPEEIIVSVRRKDENLQEVPISVSTIGAADIERIGINDVQDVVTNTAGLEFDEGFGAQDTRITIRGLSPTRGRSNVAFLVDGVDFTGEAVSTAGGGVMVNQQLLDVERVEIVKGPQSAMYGRSAFAGAIQYITKRPRLDETEASIAYELSSDGRDALGTRLSGAYGTPVTDTFGLRVNGLVYDEDGFYDNTITGGELGGTDGYGAAISGLWQASSNVTVNGRIAYSHDELDPRSQARVANNLAVDIDQSLAVQNGETDSLYYTNTLGRILNASYPVCGPATQNADGSLGTCLGAPKTITAGKMPDADDLAVVISNNPRTGGDYPGTDIDMTTATFSVVAAMGEYEFSSYTGLAHIETDQFFDGQWDALPAGSYSSLDGTYSFTLADCGFANCSPVVQEISFGNETDMFSQEFRLASQFDGPVNFTVGALYWRERVDQDEDGSTISPAAFRLTPVFPPNIPGGAPPVQSLPPGNANVASVYAAAKSFVGRDTDSYSLYALIDWEIAAAWKLSVEGRWVNEDLTVYGPHCDVDATEALTGLATQVIGGQEYCNSAFRGASSVGIANGSGTLANGTYTKAVFQNGSADFDDEFFVPKATLEWTPGDTQLFYASISKGVKPGGISTIAAGSFFNPEASTFQSEKLIAYEIGSKSTLLDGRLVLNGAAFFQDYTDKQVGVSRFDPVIQTDVGAIQNAGEAEIWGIELQAAFQVTENLSLSASYAWLDAEYTDFAFRTSSTNNVARSLAAGGGGCLALIDIDPNPGAPTANDGLTDECLVSLTGNEVEDIPEHSFVGNAHYEAPLGVGNMSWYAETTAVFTDQRYMDEFNVKELDSYWLFNLRAGLREGKWDVTLFVDNLLDDDTIKSGADFGSQVNTLRQGQFPPAPTDGVVVSMPNPRVVGIRGAYRF
ncbi:MAG: TonB-dependent receptor [Gammaproteobacteria bacterium]|nr:TonB-dependent receptor [Gammaproteobacteria bacterium]